MTRTEWLTGRMLALDDSEAFLAAGDRHWRAAGMAEEAVATARLRGNTYRRGVTVSRRNDTGLWAARPCAWAEPIGGVIVGRGHAPELITLWSEERGILLPAGHQVLPRISPVRRHLGQHAGGGPPGGVPRFARPLSPSPRGLPGAALAPPAVPGAGGRKLEELRRHHEDRLDRGLGACAHPVTAAGVMAHLFDRPLDLHQQGFALAETYAHLAHLVARGQAAGAVLGRHRRLALPAALASADCPGPRRRCRRRTQVVGNWQSPPHLVSWTQSQPECVDCGEGDGVAEGSGELVPRVRLGRPEGRLRVWRRGGSL